jgi:hypothetical protein
MKLLFENWRKFLKEAKLRVFDFDDTLAKTDSKIILHKPDGSTLVLSPAEFAVYKPEPEDEFDFSQFEGPLINPREVRAVAKVFRRVMDAGFEDRKVAILTARSVGSQDAIKGFVSDMGYNPEDIEVVTLGSSDPADKASWIDQQIQQGYNDVYFVDDSHKNVEAVSLLKQKYQEDPNIKIRTQEAM